MRIAVVGTGYVGLVSGTCFADSGNVVTCLDINADKIARLNRGDIPIYEPGLEELVSRNVHAGRLRFTTDTAAAMNRAEIVFLAVGTPPAADGSADLTALWKVTESIAPHLDPAALVVTKSTVPVGTCAGIEARLRGVGLDVSGEAFQGCFVADQMVEGFFLPERPGAAQVPVGLVGGE